MDGNEEHMNNGNTEEGLQKSQQKCYDSGKYIREQEQGIALEKITTEHGGDPAADKIRSEQRERGAGGRGPPNIENGHRQLKWCTGTVSCAESRVCTNK